jgi:hypothetical protein
MMPEEFTAVVHGLPRSPGATKKAKEWTEAVYEQLRQHGGRALPPFYELHLTFCLDPRHYGGDVNGPDLHMLASAIVDLLTPGERERPHVALIEDRSKIARLSVEKKVADNLEEHGVTIRIVSGLEWHTHWSRAGQEPG